MSYEIIKKIQVRDGKVFITCASNNVYPRTPHEDESYSLSKILKEEGQEALDIEILAAYESGNFQKGSNKYTRALEVLRHMDEYKEFDWRGDWSLSCGNRNNRKEEFKNLLKRALNAKTPKDKYVISKMYGQRKVYFNHRKNSRFANWYDDVKRASVFHFIEDAESTMKYFSGSKDWEIIKIN